MQRAARGADRERVLVVSHGYEAIYERGFCNGLSDNRFHFTLVSSDRTDYAGLRPDTNTLNLRGSQNAARSAWRKAVNLLRYHTILLLHVAHTRPRVVHVVGLLYPALLAGVIDGIWFRIFSDKYVLTVHDLLPHDQSTWYDRLLFNWSFRLAGVLIAHTPKVRQALIERHRIEPERIIVMEHGLEPLPILPDTCQRAASGAWNILFFGKVMRYKGVDMLLEALASAPFEFRLVIAGVGTDAAHNLEIERAIASHPRRDWLVWHNRYIDEAELPSLFGAANVVVLPYRRIDQSGILFQALRHGVPIVATPVGTFEHYVTGEVGEVAEGVDARLFLDALVRCHSRRTSLTRAHVMEVGRHYEWRTTVRVLARLYPHRQPDGEFPAQG